MVDGLRTPSTNGELYGSVPLVDVDDSQEVQELPETTGTIMIRAHPENDEVLYIGWDEDVTPDNGFPLSPGDAVSLELNMSSQMIWFAGTNAGDELRLIATN